jgi:hypothetical protein
MSEHDVKELVEFVRKANRDFKESMERRNEFEKYVKDSVEKAIKEAGFQKYPNQYKLSVGLWSESDEWAPEVFIRPTPLGIHLSPSPHTNKGLFFLYVGDGKFMWSEHQSKVYPDRRINNLPAPYDTEKLFAVCKSQSEVLGIPVNILVSPIITEIKGNPDSALDLLVLHPGGEVKYEGRITYHGWDCTDKWAIVWDPKSGHHFYYGSSAHGGGMGNHIAPGQSFDGFLEFAEDSDTDVGGLSIIKTTFNL